MRHTYILIFLFGVLLKSNFILGQVDISSYCDSLYILQNHTTNNILAERFNNLYPALDGQYYLNWGMGTIYYKDGRILKNKMICYHAYSDNLHWQRQSDKLVGEIPKESIEKVVIQTKSKQNLIFKKVSIRLPLSFKNSDVLLQVLNHGNIELYCFRKTKYIKNSKDGFYPDHQYYLKTDNEFNPISLSKSGLLSSFNKEEKQQIVTVIKENKLKVRHEVDMVKAITLLNEQIK